MSRAALPNAGLPPATSAGLTARLFRLFLLPYLALAGAVLIWLLVLDNARPIFTLPVCLLAAVPVFFRGFVPDWYPGAAIVLLSGIYVMRLALDIWLPV